MNIQLNAKYVIGELYQVDGSGGGAGKETGVLGEDSFWRHSSDCDPIEEPSRRSLVR